MLFSTIMYANRHMPVGAAATLACLYEATAPKAGNVHPAASFDDAKYSDFVASAVLIGPILDRTSAIGVGATVLESVRATHAAVGTNTNLGTLLLLAPMAAVPRQQSIAEGIQQVLDGLDAQDTRFVYESIRVSRAGGLGQVENADVFVDSPAELKLVDAMGMAEDRDRVARQYTHGFADVTDGTAKSIADGLVAGWRLSQAIVFAHVRQIAQHGDSLIGRKCGPDVSAEARQRAHQVCQAGSPGDVAYEAALTELDAWLRSDRNRRNPGTTADLIAAGLFVLLREGRLHWNCW
jgi:triphosphoribosyl-dephospho-CoA synthase